MMTPATKPNGTGWAEAWLRGLMALLVVGVLGTAVGWAGWTTTCLMEVRERVVSIEVQVKTHIRTDDSPHVATNRTTP